MAGLFDSVFRGGNTGQGILGDLAGVFDPNYGQMLYNQHQQQQGIQATINALDQLGVPHGLSIAAGQNPKEFGPFAAPYLPQPPKVQFITDAFGNQIPVSVRSGPNPSVQQMSMEGTEGGLGPSFLNHGNSRVDSNLTGDAYLQQFSPEVQQYIKGYMRGDIIPTGQGRNKSMAELAKKIGPKYAAETGQEWNENLFAERRKMQTDLASSSPNSMGGIMANGRSAFQHLGELGDAFAGMHNYSGNSIPGSALVAGIGNSLTNSEILRTQPQANAIAATRSPLLKYGQESTKFYAGTGGSKEERTKPETNINVQHATSGEMAAFLKAERKLMLDRFEEKENQFSKIMGQDYLQRHPLRDPLMQQNLDRIDQAIARLDPSQAQSPAAPAGQRTTKSGISWSIGQ